MQHKVVVFNIRMINNAVYVSIHGGWVVIALVCNARGHWFAGTPTSAKFLSFIFLNQFSLRHKGA